MAEIIRKARRSLSFGRELENLNVPSKQATEKDADSPSALKRFRKSLTFGKAIQEISGVDNGNVWAARKSTEMLGREVSPSPSKPISRDVSPSPTPKVQTDVAPANVVAGELETETPVDQYGKSGDAGEVVAQYGATDEGGEVVLVRRFSKAQSAKYSVEHLRDGAAHRVEMIGISARHPQGEAAALDAISEFKSPVSPASPSIFEGKSELVYFAIAAANLGEAGTVVSLTADMLDTFRHVIDIDTELQASRKQTGDALSKLEEKQAALEKRQHELWTSWPRILDIDSSNLSEDELVAQRFLATIEESIAEASFDRNTWQLRLENKRKESELFMHETAQVLVGLIGDRSAGNASKA